MNRIASFLRDVAVSFLAVAAIFTAILVTEQNGHAHVATYLNVDQDAASALSGNPLHCESVKDPDRRHFCRATTIPRRSECELIRNHDLRQYCRATVKR